MKKIKIMAVLFCLLACASQVSAQLIIRNNGHAEVGTNPNANDQDTLTVLKVFGSDGDKPAAARTAYGNGQGVMVGELGTTGTNRLWLHGKDGVYMSVNGNQNTVDTVMYFDPSRSQTPAFFFAYDVNTSGVFLQSDERFKENVEPVEDVLAPLMNLEAVSYNLKGIRASNARRGVPGTGQADGSERYGFLAQNVKEVFPQLVHTDNSGYMYVDYIGLIPILVQSINELQAKLDALENVKNDESVPASLAAQQAGQSELEATLGAAKLYQNAPNPWSSETVIRYSLPQSVANADIYIYDMQGTQLKRIPAQGRGENQVTLTAHDLKAGMYIYALVADGALIDSKQMILTK